VLYDRNMRVPAGPIPVIWTGLVGLTVFAFLLGYGRGYTPQTMHDFVKFLLAVGIFLLTLILVRRAKDAVLVVRMLLVGVVAASSIALLLYAGGPARTEQALTRLVPYGYPGARIVRFIEDDPARPMRAVGTGVDPNSFGGLMAVGAILGAGQLLGRRPMVNRWLAGSAMALCSIALLLTYSRGAWIGALAGLAVILMLRRRALLPALGLAGVAVVALGFGSGFIDRLWQGFTLQDPATRLRLQEYQNAIEIIRRHPWFGIGFGEAGVIDLQEGVSSTYLTVAEISGLVGLAAFLLAIGAVLLTGFRRILLQPSDEITDLQLTVTAAFCGILVIALVDHYFFNIRFPHMAALFWIIAGLIVSVARLPESQPDLPEIERNSV
jgi:polysaccharide biosynthesis protein PslJ